MFSFQGVMGIADASEKLAQNFHIATMGPKLISSGASVCYEIDKQKKVGKNWDKSYVLHKICLHDYVPSCVDAEKNFQDRL